MIGNRRCAFALATVFTIICSIAPANAAQFDGNWSMVAVTTSGHCGQIPIGLGISAVEFIPPVDLSLRILFSWAAAYPPRGRSR